MMGNNMQCPICRNRKSHENMTYCLRCSINLAPPLDGINFVENPPHYNNGGAKCSSCEKTVECIDVTRHMSFNLGNAIKYIWRCELKGNKREDLEKAIWYLKDELKKQ
jgi:hypothetical protein